MNDFYKLPRLFTESPLNVGADLIVSESAHHYLKNVMRLDIKSELRFFNGRDGEFVGVITEYDKKRTVVNIQKQIATQRTLTRRIHLLFAPIKKERMEWLIEKAVELGATDLHPILTQNTDLRKINDEKISLQIIEAAEQCERMDIPALHPVSDLWKTIPTLNGVSILAAIERLDAKPIRAAIPPSGDIAILIGPAGGFTSEEKERLAKTAGIVPVSLGDNILRAETAAIAALSALLG